MGNWNGGAGRHLSNQNQLICIRREATRSRICYSQEGGAVFNDFLISAASAAGDVSSQVGILGAVSVGCGNYGSSGSLLNFDFFHIPMASADGTVPLLPATSNFCGGGLVASTTTATLSMTMAANQVTICSRT